MFKLNVFSNGADKIRGIIFAFASACLITAHPAWAMSPPPMMSVNVAPTSLSTGIGNSTREGFGVTLSTRQSTRDTRRSGTNNVDNPDNEKTNSLRTNLLLDHLFTESITGIVLVPHIYTKAQYRDPTQNQNITQTTNALGDIALYAKYSFRRDRFENPTQEWLGIIGIELPTGATDIRDSTGALLTATQQPGSNSTDVIIGGAFLWGLKHTSLYGDLTYKINGNGEGYQFGNVLGLNVGLNYKVAKQVSLLGEINGEFVAGDTTIQSGPGVSNGSVTNTGGKTIYFSPGIQWSPAANWAVNVGIQLPIYQNFDGTQLAAKTNLNFALSKRF